LIKNVDVMHFAVTDEDKRWNVAAEIKQRMQFYRRFG